jgi:hypothetical protein
MKWKTENREKVYAQERVYRLIRRGALTRKPCDICGDAAEAHHEDYSKPLEVQWLCHLHHAQRHAERVGE